MTAVRLGFIGFGEAAQRFAADLTAAGLTGIVAYSRAGARAGGDDPLRARAIECGVELVSSPREVCERASLVVSLTPGSAALAALRAIRPHLRPEHLYVDASTSSVKDMEKAAALLEGRAGFVDAAVMDPVPMHGIRVLTVVSGARAEAFRALLEPYGMNLLVVSDKPGAASAMKLIRSVCMKGLAALLIESLEAAQRYGIADAMMADMVRFFEERPFGQIAKRFVCGTAIHAGRRIHESSQSMALFKALGASTVMTRATRTNLQAIDRMGLRERFGGREPGTIGEVLEAIVEIRGPAGPAPRAATPNGDR